jgi:hypothetical protein
MMIPMAYGQSTTSLETEMLKKLSLNAKAYSSAALFVHTDKTLYTNSENIWFAAYLLNCAPDSINAHRILSVAIVGEDDRKVYQQDKYVMQDGLGSGSIWLSDSIPPGDYQFIASTDLLNAKGLPVAVFNQPITIKDLNIKSFNATLNLLDTAINNGRVRAEVIVNDISPGPKEKKASIEYRISNGETKRAVLKNNTYVISLPAEQLNQANPILFTSVKYKSSVQHLNLKLPDHTPEKIKIKFLPEGGSLITGVENLVGWEAKTSNNLPIALQGILYQNNSPIDTVATNTSGAGAFILKPDGKSRYSLKINRGSNQKEPTSHPLPEPNDNGIALHLYDAMINDTLRISVKSKTIRDIHVLVHNYREAFAFLSTQAGPTLKKINLALPAIGKGLATVTILDKDGAALAERLFFARYHEKITPTLSFNKTSYSKRDSVEVVIRLTNKQREPVDAILSVAAIHNNRIEPLKVKDIQTYSYLEKDLGPLPPFLKSSGFSDKTYIENLLLIKGWMRYNWLNLTTQTEGLALASNQSALIRAQVTLYAEPLKKPVAVNIINPNSFKIAVTESDGSFIIERDALITAPGKNPFLSVAAKKLDGYMIELNDPFFDLSKKISAGLEIPPRAMPVKEQSTTALAMKGIYRTLSLKEVVINSKREIYGRRTSNDCGDYVCVYNLLNCPNHIGAPTNIEPQIGSNYRTSLYSEITSPYKGCDKKPAKVSQINGIYTSKEFNGLGSDPIELLEPQYLTTVFWKPELIIKNGEASLRFKTGDIPGNFSLIIQGISGDDVVYGKAAFSVK